MYRLYLKALHILSVIMAFCMTLLGEDKIFALNGLKIEAYVSKVIIRVRK
jgi:hypothetical protein